MMQLGRVSRASFYRFDENTPASHGADMDLRDAIQRIALEWPGYGRPRITAQLRRHGWKVNPKMALSRRSVQPGLVHHSDRGSQYASSDYTDLLKENGIGVSMSRKGNPWDNAACESFMKTLKYEEVFRSEYRDLQEAHRSIREFVEKIYNEKRLHSALGYVPPTEFEASLAAQQNEAATRRLSV